MPVRRAADIVVYQQVMSGEEPTSHAEPPRGEALRLSRGAPRRPDHARHRRHRNGGRFRELQRGLSRRGAGGTDFAGAIMVGLTPRKTSLFVSKLPLRIRFGLLVAAI